LALWLCIALPACGGAALPTEQLTTAKASMAAAEQGGAPNEPEAALRLKYARDQIEQAEKLIAEDENEGAAWLLKRATVDANLALALAEQAQTAAAAQKAKEDLEKLKKELTEE
jgi:hypothetical protein